MGSPTAPARSHIPKNASTVATVQTIVCRRRTGMPSVAARSARSALPRTGEADSPAAMQILLNYRWSGNIRELENVIERACVTSRDNLIDVSNLPPELAAPAPQKLPFHVDLDRPLPDLLREATANIEQQYLRKALKKARGNVVRAAKICGLSRRSVTAKIAEYGIDRTAFKE